MEVDEDDENIGTEIGPGCYPLDLDIQNLGPSKLWIRQDYIRIYGFCDKLYNTLKDDYCGTRVVITGQPGIGKSYWIGYALRRRLGEGKLVIWYRERGCYLFAADGVYRPSLDTPSRSPS
ncbi:hypothetical protein BJV78DRAFT_1203405 [Lactifluus subvellereus]|nr:hypothetical protein BJV78DRAFT_1203405 [Lactifluus subvellereus]